MRMTEELEAGRQRWRRLTVYLRFEHAVVLILTAVISVIIVAAIWKLAVKVLDSLVLSNSFDLTVSGAATDGPTPNGSVTVNGKGAIIQ